MELRETVSGRDARTGNINAEAELPPQYNSFMLRELSPTSPRAHSVVVITSALHAEGPRFDPEWAHIHPDAWQQIRVLLAERGICEF